MNNKKISAMFLIFIILFPSIFAGGIGLQNGITISAPQGYVPPPDSYIINNQKHDFHICVEISGDCNSDCEKRNEFPA